ncbi:hypothetical protein BKH43_05420 [Helicobacter sp. 13S00401-1]|nr:hypothetical protein BKH43_05420 [Helicobacter sp. 13S00401-1]
MFRGDKNHEKKEAVVRARDFSRKLRFQGSLYFRRLCGSEEGIIPPPSSRKLALCLKSTQIINSAKKKALG